MGFLSFLIKTWLVKLNVELPRQVMNFPVYYCTPCIVYGEFFMYYNGFNNYRLTIDYLYYGKCMYSVYFTTYMYLVENLLFWFNENWVGTCRNRGESAMGEREWPLTVTACCLLVSFAAARAGVTGTGSVAWLWPERLRRRLVACMTEARY